MKKKYWRIGLLAVLGIILLALIIAPSQVKKQVVKRSKDLVGRQISLSSLKVNYFTSTVRIIDFKLYEVDEEELFISFDTLLVNLAPLKLIRKNFFVKTATAPYDILERKLSSSVWLWLTKMFLLRHPEM